MVRKPVEVGSKALWLLVTTLVSMQEVRIYGINRQALIQASTTTNISSFTLF